MVFVLLREQRRHVGEGLELDGVARRIEKEHGGLLAHFALKADVRLDDEVHFGGLQLVSQFSPLRHAERGAEMAHRYLVIVHLAGCHR